MQEKLSTTYHSTLYIITLFFTFNKDPYNFSMAESPNSQLYKARQTSNELPRSHKVVKAITAATTGGSLLALSGLTMTGTVIALAIATPLFVIFSPVLVPAAITVSLLIMGFLISGGFGIAAAVVLWWFFRYVAGRRQDANNDLPGKKSYKFGGKGIQVEG